MSGTFWTARTGFGPAGLATQRCVCLWQQIMEMPGLLADRCRHQSVLLNTVAIHFLGKLNPAVEMELCGWYRSVADAEYGKQGRFTIRAGNTKGA